MSSAAEQQQKQKEIMRSLAALSGTAPLSPPASPELPSPSPFALYFQSNDRLVLIDPQTTYIPSGDTSNDSSLHESILSFPETPTTGGLDAIANMPSKSNFNEPHSDLSYQSAVTSPSPSTPWSARHPSHRPAAPEPETPSNHNIRDFNEDLRALGPVRPVTEVNSAWNDDSSVYSQPSKYSYCGFEDDHHDCDDESEPTESLLQPQLQWLKDTYESGSKRSTISTLVSTAGEEKKMVNIEKALRKLEGRK